MRQALNSNRVHVLHVIDQLAVGGAERMLVDLANQAVVDGYRISACITREGGELADELRPEVEVLELGRQRRFDGAALRRLGRFVRERSVDVLHVHGRSSFSLVALSKALGLLSAPVLLHDHRSIEIDDSVPGWFRVAEKLFLDQYVGVYNRLGEWACSAGVASGKVHVIGNALDLQRLAGGASAEAACDASVPSGGLVGVTVAGLREEKGTDTLLEAIAQVPRDLDVSIQIIGGVANSAYAERCRRLCSVLDIWDRVSFLGMRRDVPALLRQADFAVMPSRSESGPLVLIEYMAFGLPFVATRVGDVSEKAERLGLGEFIPPGDPGAMAGALERLLRLAPEQRKHQGSLGQSVARQHFDVRAVAPEWYHLYDRMTAA